MTTGKTERLTFLFSFFSELLCVAVKMSKEVYLFVCLVAQSLRSVQFFATLWTEARRVSLSFTISLSLIKLMSIESVMPSNDLILCHPLLLQPSILPSIRVFSSESALLMRWPKY